MTAETMTKEELQARAMAKKEVDIPKKALIAEIGAMCKDYFVADIQMFDEAVRLTFPNGQFYTLYIK